MIYTFYSYKGGAGRSMALANVGQWLYLQGLRVVMIDWDLEAPGLESFFYSDAEQLELVRSQLGLIDLLLDYKRQFPRLGLIPETASLDDRIAVLEDNLAPVATALFCIHRSLSDGQTGSLSLLPAGWRSRERFATYAMAVQSFDWAELYADFDGEAYFEWLRRELVSNDVADVVLIDSRTGVTEMGGVCTRQLADVVVGFCVPNTQSLDGVATMASSFTRDDVLAAREGRSIEIVVVPTRVENSEIDARNAFERQFHERLDQLTPAALRRLQRSYWDLRIPYIPKYAYAESLAIGVEGAASELVSAYEQLGQSLLALIPESSDIVAKVWPETSAAIGRAVRPAPIGVPEVPAAFVARPELTEAARRALLDARSGSTVGLVGLPGAGKSLLARALGRDRLIQRAFPDGVLWADFEEGRARMDVFQALLSQLGHDVSPAEVTKAAYAQLANLLYDRELLLILDHVTDAAQLQPFLNIGPRCKRLIVTRDSAVLPHEAARISVGEMTVAEAVMLLRSSLPYGSDEQMLRSLASGLRHFPLLLAQAGGMLADTGGSDRTRLALSMASVERIAASVLSTLPRGLYLEGLSRDERRRLAELVIFQVGPVEITTIGRLWAATADLTGAETQLLCTRFKQLSLLELDVETVEVPRIAHLLSTVDLLDEATRLHRVLLDSFNVSDWRQLPSEETYLWRALAWHLVHAGRGKELRGLVLDFDWLVRQLELGGPQALLLDVDLLPRDGDAAIDLLRDHLIANFQTLKEAPDRLAPILAENLPAEGDLQALVERARQVSRQQSAPVATPEPVSAPGGIFISKRREDGAWATRIYDALRTEFGPERVFLDLASLAPGVDWQQSIDEMVTRCRVMLVIIGRNWAPGLPEVAGINAALGRGLRIIPVLVSGASMPKETRLPPAIAQIARLNALDVSESRWSYDIGRLVELVSGIVSDHPKAVLRNATVPAIDPRLRPTTPAARARGFVSALLIGLGALAFLLILLVAGIAVWSSLQPPRTTPVPTAPVAPSATAVQIGVPTATPAPRPTP